MKKEEKPFDKYDIDFRFNGLIKNVNKAIDDFDVRIETEIAKACEMRKAGRIEEENKIKDKIGRLLSLKLNRQSQLDKIEITRDKIFELLDNIEFARTVGSVYSGIGKFVDKKEMNLILKDLNVFNKEMTTAEKNINVLMDTISEKMDVTASEKTQVDSLIQNQYDQMMASYERRIEESAKEDLDAFVLK